MKKGLLLLVVLLMAIAVILILRRGQAGPGAHSIARIYFAGTNTILSDPISATLTNKFGCPEAVALENQTLDKLSHAPGVWFKDKLPAGTSDGSAQLRPLLDDFLKSEWIFEMRDGPVSPEYALAIRLDDSRAQLWLNNLRGLLESWTKISAKNIPGGWELKKDLPPNLFRIVRAGDWVVVGCGQDKLPLSGAWSRGKIPQEETSWLSARLDWPRLAQIFPAFAKFDFPRIEMQVNGLVGNLKVTGQLDLSQPLPPLEKWQIPTNLIHEPLSSFTAVRGFAPWLEKQPWASRLKLSPEPDQAFSWSQKNPPLQTFLAVPAPNATNALAQLHQNLFANTNWESRLTYGLDISQTTNAILLGDLPYIQPEIDAISGSSGDFLLAGVLPNLPGRKTLPKQLLEAVNKDNQVFYHWEITSERLAVLPQLTQLALFMTRNKQLDPGEAASQWLSHIGPTLGNCVTEATETGPSEISFVRTAPAGLTAIELIALANWLEAPNFPGCDLSLPSHPPVPRHKHPHHKKLSAAAPGAAPPKR